ncbi:sigma-70 family RNA polymerase sigma factor [Nitratireductor soli]|uniref:sigma-70 family RNA polymerase sigma factor n=1 Tax=Nitratireductor soli TaxID=1670619 RepID=UPI00065E300B|nr:sigma-70 family RNA polymerase sigma factor [Nitratireductor soli]
MDENKFLAEQFEAKRGHLRGVAYRMLGSLNEAEDAVQEAWLRLARSDESEIANLGGWLTTVVGRICLDMLRARKARREDPLEPGEPRSETGDPQAANPEEEMAMADSVGLALLVVLEKLAPAERLAFVLHDMFAVPFEAIAPIVNRTPAAARQLASRARQRVQGKPALPAADRAAQRSVVDAFLAAARNGDFNALLSVLDPEVMFRADGAAAQLGSLAEIRGAEAVANSFKGRAQGARPVLVDGALGLLVAPGGRLRIVLNLTIRDGRIAAINAIAEPAHLEALELAVLDD